MSVSSARLEQLILDHFDGRLTPEEENELAQRLADSDRARELFCEYARLEALQFELGQIDFYQDDTIVRATTNETTGTETFRRPVSSRWNRRVRFSLEKVTLAAVAMIVCFAVWTSTRPETDDGAPTSVARFSRLVNAEWTQPTSLATRSFEGDAIYPGQIDLRNGLAEIEFPNGATVILEGPAKLDIASGNHAFLHYGRLRSVVPPEAIGFTVESRDVKIIDLGTEFGFEVDPEGVAEVHVFDGEVELLQRQRGKSQRLLTAGQAVQFEPTGWQREMSADQTAFVDAETLSERANEYVANLREQAKSLSRTFRDLSRRRKQRESEIRKSVAELQKKADRARKKADEVIRSDSRLSRLLTRKTRLQDELDDRINQVLRKTNEGRRLLEEFEQVSRQLAQARQRVGSAKELSAGRKNRSNSTLRRLQKRKFDLRNRLRKSRSQIRKTDPGIREQMAVLQQTKREFDTLVKNSRAAALNEKAQRLRAQYLRHVRERMHGDSQLKSIRTQIDKVASELRSIQKKIQWANKQQIDHFLLEGESLVPEITDRQPNAFEERDDDVKNDISDRLHLNTLDV